MNTIKKNAGLPDIFRSKRFLTAVTGLFAMVLVGTIPGLEGSESLFQQSAFALTVGLVGSFTGQDWIVAAKQGESKYQPKGTLIAGELLSTLQPVQEAGFERKSA